MAPKQKKELVDDAEPGVGEDRPPPEPPIAVHADSTNNRTQEQLKGVDRPNAPSSRQRQCHKCANEANDHGTREKWRPNGGRRGRFAVPRIRRSTHKPLAQRKSSPKVAGDKASLHAVLALALEHRLRQGRDLRCSDLFSCAVSLRALTPFPSRAKPPAAVDRSARELRINARCAVMRNSRALRLRLLPDGGFDQHKHISR